MSGEVHVSVKIPTDLAVAVDRFGEHHDASRSWAVRRLLRAGLERHAELAAEVAALREDTER